MDITGLTPEQAWIRIKDKFNIPEELNELMIIGFNQSNDETEKWVKLTIMLYILQTGGK